MGGFLSWRVGNFLPVMLGLWPVIALSGTLAGEAAKGSLDLLAVDAAEPARRSRSRSSPGHVTAVAFAMLILAVAIWLVGERLRRRCRATRSRSRPRSARSCSTAMMMLAVGGVAFATAPFVGRTRAMAFGLIVLFASYLIYSYATLSPVIDALKPLSFFSWTAGHRPMAGVTDWPSVGAAGRASTSCCFAVGVVAFARRDLGGVANVGWLRLPSLPAGIAGPFSRQLADRAGVAIAWGLGIGLYGILIVASADAFSDMHRRSLPQIAALINVDLPGPRPDPAVGGPAADLLRLRLVHLRAGGGRRSWPAGRATRGGAGSRSSCRRRGRGRSWTVRSGLGVLAAIGRRDARRGRVHRGRRSSSQGGDVGRAGRRASASSASPRPAFAGIGLAVGGLVRSSLAAGVTAVLVIATFLLDTLGAALKLPEWVLELSIYKHLGQPMAGIFDPVGHRRSRSVMVVGGLALCAFGLTRRDIGR